MAIHMYISFEEIPYWCAALKMCNVTKNTVKGLNWSDIVQSVIEDYGAPSCICVSVNISEIEVIQWLTDNKFRRGPCIRNWGHAGRKTYMYFKQITKRDWVKYGGPNHW